MTRSAPDPTDDAKSGPLVVVERADGTVVLAVSGDLAYETVSQMREKVLTALARLPASVVLDLRDVGFLDSAGLALLVEAAHVRGSQTPFRVIAVGSPARSIQLAGLSDHLGLRLTID